MNLTPTANPGITPSMHPHPTPPSPSPKPTRFRLLRRLLPLALLLASLTTPASRAAEPVRVVVTSTDVASLAREVGGDRVRVYCLSQGPEDPHTLEIKPGFVRELSQAHLFVQVGLGLENAWIKDLLAGVRNPELKPGGRANLNLGRGVRPLPDSQTRPLPGSFHEEGNPHYLLDPLEGLRAARALRDKLAELQPGSHTHFHRRHQEFHHRLATALVGPECAGDSDLEEVVLAFEAARSRADLDALLQEHKVGGWLAASLPWRGRPIVGDHDLWPYFARRFGADIIGYLEPSPGSPPTTRHLQDLIRQMQKRQVRIVLATPYFDPQPVRFVAEATQARILPMAHQTGARTNTTDYLSMLRHNVDLWINAASEKRP